MTEYTFEVRLRAVVRVRASSEELARKVIPSVLGAPGTVEIGLANQNNAGIGSTSTVTEVVFHQERRTKCLEDDRSSPDGVDEEVRKSKCP
jgi:hypothetical protein